MTEAKAFDSYGSNADLIALCADLGYLRADWSTLDATWGRGIFWDAWHPEALVALDLVAHKVPARAVDGAGRVTRGVCGDFTTLPFRDRAFDAVVFDGPYKLNGTPDEETDERYGVHLPTRWQDRMALLEAGTIETARVARRRLLVKCQDQVCSGEIRFQTRVLADVAEAQGFRLVQMLHKEGGRPQPEWKKCRACQGLGHRIDLGHAGEACLECEGEGGKPIRKVHARQNYSTLLVLDRLSPRRLANRG